LNPGNSPPTPQQLPGNQCIAPVDRAKAALESRRFDENPVLLGKQSDLLEPLDHAHRARASWSDANELGSGSEQDTQQPLAIMKAHRNLQK
jgi:hypothetical protein